MKYDVVIVGAGTAGLSAAIYTVRAGKSALVLDAVGYGGQIINTPEVANYPGIKNISGFEFATGLYEQAKDLGAEIVFEKVMGIKDLGNVKYVTTEKNEYECSAVILATGAKNRPLGLEHETEWIGRGVSYCATCDGAFFRKKVVAVAGGGNTALEDAAFLANYCAKVYLIHRRDQFRGEEKELAALKAKENVEFILNTNIVGLLGEDRLKGLRLKNKLTEEECELEVQGLFVAIGQMPDNIAFADLVNVNSQGYIEATENCKTNVPGVFTAGDCRTKEVRQLTTAAADGAIAALGACEYINTL